MENNALTKFYVVIYPQSYMSITGECGQMIITITPKNISTFDYSSTDIIGFYSGYNMAYSDAFDVWEEWMGDIRSIFNEEFDDD